MNFEEIKKTFYSYNKEKQKFIIFQIYVAAGLYLDFIGKYNIIKHKIQLDTPILFCIIYGYFYMYLAHIVLYIVFNKNTLEYKLRKIKNFSYKFKN
tara:strand:- start:818 stop:1105 length:288 start_codon:yes stop_codon:yes gene_type:complete